MSLSVAELQLGRQDAEAMPILGGRWLNVVSHLDARYGGLSAVVPQLASAIAARSDLWVSLAAFCTPDEICAASTYPAITISRWPSSRMTWLRERQLRAQFEEQVKQATGVHIHGLWEQSTAVAAQTARSLRKPYILSAHGMLESWALRHKRLKKAIYAALAERENIDGAACLHALTHAEAEDYRRFGCRGPIAVIPNGVTIPEVLDPQPFLIRFPALEGKRIVLFLGRIHFKKGLDLLVEAWANVAERWPDAHLVLAGPDFEGTRAKIETLIGTHRLAESVTFTGMLRDELKWSALAASQCFVLPSYSEGLSVSTLEAMGCGLPVIVTQQCNLPEVAQRQAGWTIEPKPEQLQTSLNEFFDNSKSANQDMGSRGRRLIHEQYNWTCVAQKMDELYHWVQGGPSPGSFDLLRVK